MSSVLGVSMKDFFKRNMVLIIKLAAIAVLLAVYVVCILIFGEYYL